MLFQKANEVPRAKKRFETCQSVSFYQ